MKCLSIYLDIQTRLFILKHFFFSSFFCDSVGCKYHRCFLNWYCVLYLATTSLDFHHCIVSFRRNDWEINNGFTLHHKSTRFTETKTAMLMKCQCVIWTFHSHRCRKSFLLFESKLMKQNPLSQTHLFTITFITQVCECWLYNRMRNPIFSMNGS